MSDLERILLAEIAEVSPQRNVFVVCFAHHYHEDCLDFLADVEDAQVLSEFSLLYLGVVQEILDHEGHHLGRLLQNFNAEIHLGHAQLQILNELLEVALLQGGSVGDKG